MANKTVQAFRNRLFSLGCTQISIRQQTGQHGRIQYNQYRVRFVEPVGHKLVSGVYSLADMQHSLDAAPAQK